MSSPKVETTARGVSGVTFVQLDVVWDPPSSPDMMSDAAKLDLGMIQEHKPSGLMRRCKRIRRICQLAVWTPTA